MEWMLLPLRRYAEFSGRSRRMEFWMFFVLQVLINIALYALTLVLFGSSLALMAGARAPGAAGAGAMAMGGGMLVISGLYLVVGLGFIIPNFAVAVRRLHDTGRSGWWVLAPLLGYVVAIAGLFGGSRLLVALGGIAAFCLAIAVFIFYLLDGTPGPNQYGPDPKNRIDPGVFA